MLRSILRLTTLLFLSLSLDVNASVLDCSKAVELSGRSYDLSSLAGEYSETITRSTPPSTVYDVLRFDLCGDLKRDEKAADEDQVRSSPFFLKWDPRTE
jgi:autophagy-related protein 27